MDPEDTPGTAAAGFDVTPGASLLFQRVPEPKPAKNRLHLCLEPRQPRDEEVSRLLRLGASLYDDRRRPDGSGWVALQDPEGNEFCVLVSAEERSRD